MYIRSVHLENIRCIEQLDLAFEEGYEAGWHVLIGENGSGKTTVARCIALGILGPLISNSLPFGLDNWIGPETDFGLVGLKVHWEKGELKDDDQEARFRTGEMHFWKKKSGKTTLNPDSSYDLNDRSPYSSRGDFWMISKKFFAVGYGPFRRFSGGDSSFAELYRRGPIWAAQFLSLLTERYASTEPISLIKDLHYKSLDGDRESGEIVEWIKLFLNKSSPTPVQLVRVSAQGIFFVDAKGVELNLEEMSHGYIAFLSITLEIIVFMVLLYGAAEVFRLVREGEERIDLPGVVIIDEVDAHLHPTWQTQIGQWFTRYFPKLQFIVTTHSPLICRACGEHGKIFRLAAPGSAHESGEITGVDRDRLVYGDILAAYETDAFGDKVEWGQEGRELQKEYRDLAYKRRFGVELTVEETAKYERLKAIFRSHVEAD
jgi:hypothetical protein